MAKGPTPKSSKTRQRRNRTSTAATLETREQVRATAPKLGTHPTGGKWEKRTRDWWSDVWSSPMASEYLEADTDGLRMLAALIDAFWKKPHPSLAAEIRLQRVCFGLTPIDRRRLQWEVVRTEEATEKRSKKKQKPTPDPSADPRQALKAI